MTTNPTGNRIAGVLLAAACVVMTDSAQAQWLPALANVTANSDKQAAAVLPTGETAILAGSSPLTGAVLAISDTAYDAATQRLFVVDATNNKLLTISMVNGSVLANPSLGFPAGVLNVTDLEWNSSTSTLLGIVTITGGDKQLASFNTATGAVTLVGASGIEGANVGTFSQPFDLDAAGQRYYMVGSPAAGDKLYAINTATGAVADSVLLSTKLPMGTTTIFGLEYDPGESKLYGLIGLASGDKQLATINTTSGATFGNITLLGAGGIGGGTAVSLSGSEALDPTNNIYYAKGSISGNNTLFAISTTTGIATQHLLTFGPGINDVRALEFDPAAPPAPPSPLGIAKAFGPTTIAVGGVSTLTFTLSNVDMLTILTGVAFTDTFPAGLSVAATPNATTTGCGSPTFAPAAGNTSVSFSGGTIVGGGTCTVTVDVTATTAGSKVNTTGSVTSTNGGTGNTGTATLTVVAPPSIAKAFAPKPIVVGGVSTLTFTISNPNAGTALTGVAFTDSFPAGLSVAATPSATIGGCGAPTFTPGAGNTSISFSGGTIAAGGLCTVTVDVTVTTAGDKINTSGNVTSTNGGTGNTGTDTLTVAGPPSIAKAFAPNPIAVGAVSTLTFTITNSNPGTALTGVAFTDTFPAGLSVAATPNATTSGCGAATFAPAAGNTSLAFSGGTIAAAGVCTVTVAVTAATSGSKVNTTGNVTSTNGGTGNTATATLGVVTTPSISKSFGPKTIAVGGVSTLTFTLTNGDSGTALTGVAFTDTFPGGLSVAATPNATTSGCGSPTFAPAAGNTSLSFSGGTIAASGICTVTVAVTATTAGDKVNTTGNITSTNGGTGNTGTDTLAVVGPPSIAKAFLPASIPVGGVSTLTFTIGNPNTGTALTGVTFTDTFPADLAVAATPNATTSGCGAPTFAPAGGNTSIAFTGGTIAAAGTCTVSVDVTAATAGSKDNTSGTVGSSNGGSGNAAGPVSLIVVAPPAIAKAFSPTSIYVGNGSTLTFTLTNPASNGVPLTGVGFTDVLPVGLGVGASVSSACGGTVTTTPPGDVVLSAATIAVGGTCVFSVSVLGQQIGDFINVTGNVQSANGGPGSVATATLQVLPLPIVPTLSGWVLALLSALLAAGALGRLRRRRATR